MRAIVEPTAFGKVENLAEIARQLFGFDVESAETFDAGCINQVAAFGQFEHLTERRCVHTRIVCVADFGCFEIGFRQD